MSKITAFVDNVGRVIVGELTDQSESKKTLRVREPAVVNVQVNNQSGQISVQLLPFIFREFVKAECREEGVYWTFNKDNITISENLVLDDNIIKQYENIFKSPVGTTEQAVAQEPATPDVVKMFDDEA